MDSLRFGVTRVIDHHASPNAVTDSLETIATAFDEGTVVITTVPLAMPSS